MAAKEYEIAFKIAGQMSGDFKQSFKQAKQAVGGVQDSLKALNTQAAQTDKLIKLKTELSQAATTAKGARYKFKHLSEEYQSSSARVKELSKEHAAAKRQVTMLEKAAEESGTTTAEAAQKYAAAVDKVDRLGKELSQAKKETDGLEKQMSKAKTEVDKATASVNKKRESLRRYEDSVGEAGVDLKTLTQRQKELKTATDKARRSLEKQKAINDKLAKAKSAQETLSGWKSSSAGALAGIGAGVAATVGVPVQQAMAMEDAMAEVKKVVDFDTPDGLKNLQKQLEQMSLRIPMSADGLAQIAAAAGQSGIAAKDLSGFTEQAAKMAVAFDITAEEAGTMMAKWQSGMGLSMEQTYSLADATNALSNSNAATASQIGEVLQRYGALGKVAGLTEKQTAALAASVVASGAESEVAATGIKALMRALGKGDAMTDKQSEAFDKVGLDPKKIQSQLQKDAPKAIVGTLEAIQKNIPKEQWNQILSTMFGEEAAVAVGPMMQNLDGLKKNFKLVGDEAKYSGSMLKEFESRSATTSNSLELMKNAASYAARALGTPLLEPIRSVSTEFVAAAQKAGDWISKNQETVTTALKVAGAITGVVTAFHAVRLAFAFVASPVVSLYKGFQNLKKGIELVKNSTVLNTIATKAHTVATKAANLAQTAWNKCFDAAKVLGHKVALAAHKAAALASAAASKVATAAQKAWNATLSVAKLAAHKAALIAHKAAAMASTVAAKAATLAQKAWNATMSVAKIAAHKAALIAHKAATVAGTVAVKAASVAQKAWNASMSVAKIAAHKAAMIAHKGALLAWKGVCAAVTLAQKAFNLVMSANPIGLVITLLAGLVAGGIAVYKNWDTIKKKAQELWKWVKDTFGKIGDAISNAWEKAKGFFTGKKNTIEVKASGNGKSGTVRKMATGGIATGPTLALIGEGSESEAVLPLSKLDKLLSNSGNSAGGNMTVHFAPVIHVNGGGGDVAAQVQRGLDDGLKKLKRELERLNSQKRRVSYA